MGAGKSTVGRLLAPALDAPFVDLDAVIESVAGRPVARIFEHSGEEGFRALERAQLLDTARLERCVVATGGGTPVDEENRRWMRSHGTVVWLDVAFERLAGRLSGSPTRPLWRSEDGARRLFEERHQAYHDCDHAIDVGARSAAEVVEEIVTVLTGPGPAE